MEESQKQSITLNLWGGVAEQGSQFFAPSCIIQKMPINFANNGSLKIKFSLYLGEFSGFGNSHDNPIYAGQPTLAFPIML